MLHPPSHLPMRYGVVRMCIGAEITAAAPRGPTSRRMIKWARLKSTDRRMISVKKKN